MLCYADMCMTRYVILLLGDAVRALACTLRVRGVAVSSLVLVHDRHAHMAMQMFIEVETTLLDIWLKLGKLAALPKPNWDV